MILEISFFAAVIGMIGYETSVWKTNLEQL